MIAVRSYVPAVISRSKRVTGAIEGMPLPPTERGSHGHYMLCIGVRGLMAAPMQENIAHAEVQPVRLRVQERSCIPAL